MEDTKANNTEILSTQFDLDVSEDKMKVWFSCGPEFAGNENAEEKLLSKLRSQGILAKVNLEVFETAIKKSAKTGEKVNRLLLIEGRPPVQSTDGKIEWTGNFFDEGYYVDPETGRIDFHQKAEDPSVDENQLLVVVTQAINGVDGRDVYGKSLTVPKPKKIFLKPGPNVLWDEKESGYRAKCAGRVKLRGNALDVNPVHYVSNGVNPESGNIKHNGQVIVDGDVETDFKIEAAGDVEIKGLVYACEITCGGNLSARDGINGNLSKNIIVGGDIVAKYIMNSTVTCRGNIIVNSEIFHSIISTKGEVSCGNGRIMGGEIMATKGITLNEAGSKGNARTLLIAGYDKELHDKLKSNFDEISQRREINKKLEKGYRKLKANRRLLNAEQKEKMTQIQFTISENEAEIVELAEDNKKVSKNIEEISRAVIKIRNLIHPGVTLRISDKKMMVDQPLAGPIYVILDRVTKEIKLSSKLDEVEEMEK